VGNERGTQANSSTRIPADPRRRNRSTEAVWSRGEVNQARLPFLAITANPFVDVASLTSCAAAIIPRSIVPYAVRSSPLYSHGSSWRYGFSLGVLLSSDGVFGNPFLHGGSRVIFNP
jgi:hypothetical protein